MIKELDALLELQKEVNSLKEKIEEQTRLAKEIADNSVEEKKKEIEKDLQELVDYIKKSGFKNTTYCYEYNFENKNISKYLYFKVYDSGFQIGYTSRGVSYEQKLGYFYDEITGGYWDPKHLGCAAPGSISTVTDYMCQNWEDIKESLIQQLKSAIERKQKNALDNAIKNLTMHIERKVS